MNYALAWPERIFGQVLTNSNSALAAVDSTVREDIRLERLDAIAGRGRAAIEALPIYPKANGRLPPDIEAELMADAALISPRGLTNGLKWTAPDLSVTARLGETRVPTLLVNGRREKRFQPLRDAAAQALPSLRIVDLEGGHPVNLDCPDAFVDAVRSFLEPLSPPG